jgi:hypothetical protein
MFGVSFAKENKTKCTGKAYTDETGKKPGKEPGVFREEVVKKSTAAEDD